MLIWGFFTQAIWVDWYDAVFAGKLNMNADCFKTQTSSNSTFRSFAAPKFENP